MLHAEVDNTIGYSKKSLHGDERIWNSTDANFQSQEDHQQSDWIDSQDSSSLKLFTKFRLYSAKPSHIAHSLRNSAFFLKLFMKQMLQSCCQGNKTNCIRCHAGLHVDQCHDYITVYKISWPSNLVFLYDTGPTFAEHRIWSRSLAHLIVWLAASPRFPNPGERLAHMPMLFAGATMQRSVMIKDNIQNYWQSLPEIWSYYLQMKWPICLFKTFSILVININKIKFYCIKQINFYQFYYDKCCRYLRVCLQGSLHASWIYEVVLL